MRLRMQTMPTTTVGSEVAVPGSSGRVALSFPPLAAPDLPISPAKEQRLQELLQQYRADLISPEQYQATRAKILSEP